MILAYGPNGVYVDATLRADNPTGLYTIYVEYRFGDEPDDTEVEELDVSAATESHARAIATAALARDYEPGGRIVLVERREPVELGLGERHPL